MDGGWIYELMDGWMDGRIHVHVDGWMDGYINGWIDGWLHDLVDGWIDGRIVWWMDDLQSTWRCLSLGKQLLEVVLDEKGAKFVVQKVNGGQDICRHHCWKREEF